MNEDLYPKLTEGGRLSNDYLAAAGQEAQEEDRIAPVDEGFWNETWDGLQTGNASFWAGAANTVGFDQFAANLNEQVSRNDQLEAPGGMFDSAGGFGHFLGQMAAEFTPYVLAGAATGGAAASVLRSGATAGTLTAGTARAAKYAPKLATFATGFVREHGDAYDRIKQMSGGNMSNLQIMALATAEAALKASVELLGVDSLAATAMARRAMAKGLKGRAASTFLKDIFEGTASASRLKGVGKWALGSLGEGAEEVVQSMIEGAVDFNVSGGQLDTLPTEAELTEAFIGGAIGGLILGGPFAMMESRAEEASNKTMEEAVKEPDEDLMRIVDSEQVVDAEGKLKRQYSKAQRDKSNYAFGEFLTFLVTDLNMEPSEANILMKLVRSMSYNMAYQNGSPVTDYLNFFAVAMKDLPPDVLAKVTDPLTPKEDVILILEENGLRDKIRSFYAEKDFASFYESISGLYTSDGKPLGEVGKAVEEAVNEDGAPPAEGDAPAATAEPDVDLPDYNPDEYHQVDLSDSGGVGIANVTAALSSAIADGKKGVAIKTPSGTVIIRQKESRQESQADREARAKEHEAAREEIKKQIDEISSRITEAIKAGDAALIKSLNAERSLMYDKQSEMVIEHRDTQIASIEGTLHKPEYIFESVSFDAKRITGGVNVDQYYGWHYVKDSNSLLFIGEDGSATTFTDERLASYISSRAKLAGLLAAHGTIQSELMKLRPEGSPRPTYSEILKMLEDPDLDPGLREQIEAFTGEVSQVLSESNVLLTPTDLLSMLVKQLVQLQGAQKRRAEDGSASVDDTASVPENLADSNKRAVYGRSSEGGREGLEVEGSPEAVKAAEEEGVLPEEDPLVDDDMDIDDVVEDFQGDEKKAKKLRRISRGPKAAYMGDHRLMVFYEGADAATVVHEWVHHLMAANLMPHQIRSLFLKSFDPQIETEDELFAQGGTRFREFHEFVANGVLTYMRGSAPLKDKAMAEGFEFVRQSMASGWTEVKMMFSMNEKRTGVPYTLNKELVDAMDGLFLGLEELDPAAVIAGSTYPRSPDILQASGASNPVWSKGKYQRWKGVEQGIRKKMRAARSRMSVEARERADAQDIRIKHFLDAARFMRNPKAAANEILQAQRELFPDMDIDAELQQLFRMAVGKESSPDTMFMGQRYGGADIRQMVHIHSASQYDKNLDGTVAKEAVQNAVFATKGEETPAILFGSEDVEEGEVLDALGQGPGGAVRSFMADNGIGMNPETIVEKYLPAYKSGQKEGDPGGYGAAKIALIGGAETWHVITASEWRGGIYQTEVRGTGAAYKEYVVTGTHDFDYKIAEWFEIADGIEMKINPLLQIDKNDKHALATGTVVSWVHENKEDSFTSKGYKNAVRASMKYLGNVKEISIDRIYEDISEVARNAEELSGRGETLGDMSYGEIEVIDTFSTPGADIQLLGRPRGKGQAWKVPVLNNGILQFKMKYGKDVRLPYDIAFNVIPKVVVGKDYPFPINRDSLIGAAKTVVEDALEALADADKARQLQVLEEVKDKAPTVKGSRSLKLVDISQAVPPDLMDRMTGDRDLGLIAKAISRAYNIMVVDLEAKYNPDGAFSPVTFGGLLLNNDAEGIRFGVPAKGTPGTMYHDVGVTARDALRISRDNGRDPNEVFAERMAGIMLHELGHQVNHTEGQEHARAMTFMAGHVAEGMVKTTKIVLRALKKIDSDGVSRIMRRLEEYYYETAEYKDYEAIDRVKSARDKQASELGDRGPVEGDGGGRRPGLGGDRGDGRAGPGPVERLRVDDPRLDELNYYLEDVLGGSDRFSVIPVSYQDGRNDGLNIGILRLPENVRGEGRGSTAVRLIQSFAVANGLSVVNVSPYQEHAGFYENMGFTLKEGSSSTYEWTPTQSAPTMDLAAKAGYIPVVHGSNVEGIKTFKTDPTEVVDTPDGPRQVQMGVHVGTTKAQAKHPVAYELFAKVNNPLRLKDVTKWDAERILPQLDLTEEEMARVNSVSKKGGFRERVIQAILKKRGYDAIVYANEFEGEGDSYILFDDSQLRTPEEIAQMDAAPLRKKLSDRRFYYSPNNVDVKWAMEFDPQALLDSPSVYDEPIVEDSQPRSGDDIETAKQLGQALEDEVLVYEQFVGSSPMEFLVWLGKTTMAKDKELLRRLADDYFTPSWIQALEHERKTGEVLTSWGLEDKPLPFPVKWNEEVMAAYGKAVAENGWTLADNEAEMSDLLTDLMAKAQSEGAEFVEEESLLKPNIDLANDPEGIDIVEDDPGTLYYNQSEKKRLLGRLHGIVGKGKDSHRIVKQIIEHVSGGVLKADEHWTAEDVRDEWYDAAVEYLMPSGASTPEARVDNRLGVEGEADPLTEAIRIVDLGFERQKVGNLADDKAVDDIDAGAATVELTDQLRGREGYSERNMKWQGFGAREVRAFADYIKRFMSRVNKQFTNMQHLVYMLDNYTHGGAFAKLVLAPVKAGRAIAARGVNSDNAAMQNLLKKNGIESIAIMQRQHKTSVKRMTAGEIVHIYMLTRDPKTRDSLIKSNIDLFPGGSEQIIADAERIVSENKDYQTVADAMFAYYNDKYGELNKVFKEHGDGRQLGNRGLHYVPVVREGEVMEDAEAAYLRVSGGDEVDVGGTARDVKPTGEPSVVKRFRGGAARPILIENPFNTFNRYSVMTNNFIGKLQRIKKITKILSVKGSKGVDLQNAFNKTFGPGQNELSTLIDLVTRELRYDGRTEIGGDLEPFMRDARNRFQVGILGARVTTPPKQAVSLLQAMANIPGGPEALLTMASNGIKTMMAMSRNIADRAANQKPADRINKSSSLYLRGTRVHDLIEEFAPWIFERYPDPDYQDLARSGRLIQLAMAPIKNVDMWTVGTAFETAYDQSYAALIGRGYDKAEAHRLAGENAADIITATQPPSLIHERTLFQTGSEYKRSVVVFSGQTINNFQEFRDKMIRPLLSGYRKDGWSGVGKELQPFRKRENPLDVSVSKRLMYGAALPAFTMFAIMNRRWPEDEEDMLRALISYPIGSIPVFGQMTASRITMPGSDLDFAPLHMQMTVDAFAAISDLAKREVGTRDQIRAIAEWTGLPEAMMRFVIEAGAMKVDGQDFSSVSKDEWLELLQIPVKERER